MFSYYYALYLNSNEYTASQTVAAYHAGLLKQLSAIKFLLWQGLALRGHHHTDGKFVVIAVYLAGDCGNCQGHRQGSCSMTTLMTLIKRVIS